MGEMVIHRGAGCLGMYPPMEKGGCCMLELGNHSAERLFSSRDTHLLHGVTIYCIDIFTKYYKMR